MLVEDVMIMALLRAGAGAAPPRGDAVVGRISSPLWDAVKCLAVLRLWTEALLSMHGANLPLLCFADENDVHRKKKTKKVMNAHPDLGRTTRITIRTRVGIALACFGEKDDPRDTLLVRVSCTTRTSSVASLYHECDR